MTFFNSVVMITVFVGLSLVCSYILFKVLKSSATVDFVDLGTGEIKRLKIGRLG